VFDPRESNNKVWSPEEFPIFSGQSECKRGFTEIVIKAKLFGFCREEYKRCIVDFELHEITTSPSITKLLSNQITDCP
jgi:hypothetical protein